MRVGGPTPYGVNGLAVALAAGGQFYIPAGNYKVTLGGQTMCEWFDPTTLCWRVVGQPHQQLFDLSCDGYNYRLVNASGVVVGAAITNAGSGATNGIGSTATGVAVSFGAAPANGQAASAYPIVGGAINTAIAITNGGSGFVVPPMLLIDPPPAGGIQATARCTISAGVINAVTVDNPGAGYTQVPLVYVIPQYGTYPGIGSPVNPAGVSTIIPPGAIGSRQSPWLPNIGWPQAPSGGAVLTVNPTLAGSGTLTGIVMTAYGAGYTGTTIPAITITGAGAAAATSIMSMAMLSGTITVGGVAYSVAPVLVSSLGMIPAAPAFNNNAFFSPRPARARTTVGGGAITVVTMEDNGFGLQSVPQVGVIQAGGTPATTVATITAVCGGLQDTSLLQPANQ